MKIRSVLLILPLAVPALLLGACHKKKEEDNRIASGKVLDGTISDKQLPLETVTSQPPLMKTVPHAAASGVTIDESQAAEDAADLDAEQPAVESQVEEN